MTSFCSLSLNGCTGGSGGDAWRYDPGIPVQVTGVEAESGNKVVTLSWNGNPLATSYNIYFVSALTATGATKSNGIKINVTTTSQVIKGLNNNVMYYFMVTALNRDGESIESVQVAATPRLISNADLHGTWYFHTLVTGAGAKWERGTMTVTMNADGSCSAATSDFMDSSGNTSPLPGFGLSVNGDGVLTQTGQGAWLDFRGIIGSRKNMMVATFSPDNESRALTIFQKKRDTSDYTISDIMGTGSGQNPNDPNLQGNGPTRFTYHTLYSGSNTEWEYCNAKVGRQGEKWLDQYKDITYWDYSTPTFKVVNFDYFWKATSIGIDQGGLVTEYWNFNNVVNPANNIFSYNYLVPKQPHETVFTGRMTADKTVIVGVSTRTDANGNNPQFFLRIMQLCFLPTDQALPQPTLNDLAGTYNFHKLGFNSSDAAPGIASWAYGTMDISSFGSTSLTESENSTGNTKLSNFVLSYYPDPNPESKSYRDFANFITPDLGGYSHYHDNSGKPFHNYYDFISTGHDINDPSTWRLEDISPYYFNEHGSLSYNRDMLVMTRTDSSGYSIIIGLK